MDSITKDFGLTEEPFEGLLSQEDQDYLAQFQADPLWNRIQDVLIAVFQAHALTDIAKNAENQAKVLAAAGGLAMVQRLLREMPFRMLEYKKHAQRSGPATAAQHVTGTGRPGPGQYEPSIT